jgi:hypothetical protein
MAYDGARHQVVLFGGLTDFYTRSGETWTWDGVAWTQQLPANSPSPKQGARMVYDAARRNIVMFGGFPGQDETWIWDGVNWVQQHPNSSPPLSFGIAYDVARRLVVLLTNLGGTWTWDGLDWTEQHPAISPPARGLPMMAYDGGRREVVLFGGENSCGEFCLVFLDDTWTWDGTVWTEQFPQRSPPPEAGSGFAYDLARHEVVLFGGFGAHATFDHTASWAGGGWSRERPANRPEARREAGMAYDAGRRQVVLFGGFSEFGVALGDTWTWDGVDWTER